MLVRDDGARPLRDIDAIEVPVGTLRHLYMIAGYAGAEARRADEHIACVRVCGDDAKVEARAAAQLASHYSNQVRNALRRILGDAHAGD